MILKTGKKPFPGIDSRIKFCLLTITGKNRPSAHAEFAFYLKRTGELKDPERRYVLGSEDFARFNPNTRTAPTFRTRRDAEIARRMYERAGVLWRAARDQYEESNPWGISFQRMFDMAGDSGLFRTRMQLEDEGFALEGNEFVRGEERFLPLYEAKLFHQYDHRFATFDGVTEKDLKSGNAAAVGDDWKANPKTVILPRYWVPEKDVVERLSRGKSRRDESGAGSDSSLSLSLSLSLAARATGFQLVLRRITNATNERTIVLAMTASAGVSDSATVARLGYRSTAAPHLRPTDELRSQASHLQLR